MRTFPVSTTRSNLKARLTSLLVIISFLVPLFLAALPFSSPETASAEDEPTKSFVQLYSISRKQMAMDATVDDGVEFQMTFQYNGSSQNKDIQVNTTNYDTSKWEIIFDEEYFRVEQGKTATITITVKTNYSYSNYGQELNVDIFGDEYDAETGNKTVFETNRVGIYTFIAQKYDPVLTYSESEANKTVTHKKETAYTFTLMNMGYEAGVPDVQALVYNGNDGWLARVIPGPDLSVTSLDSLERVTFTVNVTAPKNLKSGDYELEVNIAIGSSGYVKESVIAYIPRPDLSVRDVGSSHIIAFLKTKVLLRATVVNDGGLVKDVEVAFYVVDSDGSKIPVATTSISQISNYGSVEVSVEWETMKVREKTPVENFTIEAVVDPMGRIWETNENNNEATGKIEVRQDVKQEPSFSSSLAGLMATAALLAFAQAALFRKRKRE